MLRLIAFLMLLSGCTVHTTNKYIGAQYLDAPYVLDPLGEETAPDTDPLIRFDAFDCTTFVETVLAKGDVNKLNHIRYHDGIISFENRNHFIETQWLPNNADIVENVSRQYGRTAMRTVTINQTAWMRNVHGIDTDAATVTTRLEYIPYSELSELNIAEPLVVLFISGNSKKNDKIGTDMAVRHMGFVLPNGMLRHASSKLGRVVDENFGEYIEKRQENTDSLGIMLLEIK